MAKAKRNIGLEILEGIREIKRGEHGRVINVPAVSAVRESTGLSQSQFAELLGVSVRARCRIGNKVVEPPRALRVRCSVLWRRILESCGKSHSGATVHAHARFGRAVQLLKLSSMSFMEKVSKLCRDQTGAGA